MIVKEVTSFSSLTREFMDVETGKMLSPEETTEYLKKLEKIKVDYTRIDELAREWNKLCSKRVPYEFIEWLKMVM